MSNDTKQTDKRIRNGYFLVRYRHNKSHKDDVTTQGLETVKTLVT